MSSRIVDTSREVLTAWTCIQFLLLISVKYIYANVHDELGISVLLSILRLQEHIESKFSAILRAISDGDKGAWGSRNSPSTISSSTSRLHTQYINTGSGKTFK